MARLRLGAEIPIYTERMITHTRSYSNRQYLSIEQGYMPKNFLRAQGRRRQVSRLK